MEEWIKYQCEAKTCGRKFAVEFGTEDELEEPSCPECGKTNCVELG